MCPMLYARSLAMLYVTGGVRAFVSPKAWWRVDVRQFYTGPTDDKKPPSRLPPLAPPDNKTLEPGMLRASLRREDTDVKLMLADYGSDALSAALKSIVPDEAMIRKIIDLAAASSSSSSSPMAPSVVKKQAELNSCLELMAEGRFLDANEALGGLFAPNDDLAFTARTLEAICHAELGCPEKLTSTRRLLSEASSSSSKDVASVVAPVRDLALGLAALHVDDDASTAYAYALCAVERPGMPAPLLELTKKQMRHIDDVLSAKQQHAQRLSLLAEEDLAFVDEETEPVSSLREDEFMADLRSRAGDSRALGQLLDMVGLTEVKEACVQIKESIELDAERGEDPRAKSYSAIFTGNPGTGKSSVGRLYGALLEELKIIPGPLDDSVPPRVVETSGAKLTQMGVQEFQTNLLPLFDDDGKSQLKVGDKVIVKKKPAKGAGEVCYEDNGRFDVHFGDSVEIKADRSNLIDVTRQGGVLFIDDAWQLEPQKSNAGRQILDLLCDAMDALKGKLVVVLSGLEESLDRELFEDPRSPGLASRFRRTFKFPDFTDAELELMIRKDLSTKKSKFHVGDRKYLRIAAKRLGRQRGTQGFGNARAVENLLDTTFERQTARILKARRAGLPDPDLFEVTRDDLLGVRERLRETVEKSEAWQELHSMYGLQRVKESVAQLVTMVETNIEREELEMEPQHVSLNRVLLGNPGTGKTTVAKLYAEILRELGLLSKGDVIVKNPSDFIGSALGQSEEKTAAIIEKAKGSVLVVDEAYGLHPNPGASKRGVIGDRADPYKSAVIDTLVARVQGLAGEDQCVLLLGYKNEMEDLVRNANPGLQRRFQLDHAFHFDDYDDDALFRILVGQVKKRGRSVSFDTAKTAVRQRLAKDRLRPHFGNAGAVANLVSDAVAKAEVRLDEAWRGLSTTEDDVTAETSSETSEEEKSLAVRSKKNAMARDIELVTSDFYVPPPYADNPEKLLFDGLIGCDFIKERLRDYRMVVNAARNVGRDPLEDLPLTFAFVGSPGTGKTTIAKKMGVLFESLGVLPTSEVKVCSAADFSTGYVGQAARKTREIFESARGAVLFVDEAYRLWDARGHSYFQEATDEIVSMMTEEEFKGKMVVIFAGYDKPMREMLDNVNPGLKSRIAEIIEFPDFDAAASAELAELMLTKKQRLDVSDIIRQTLPGYAKRLVETPNYANGRDVENWVKRISGECARRGHPTVVDMLALDAATEKMIKHMGKSVIDLPTKKRKKKKKRVVEEDDDEEESPAEPPEMELATMDARPPAARDVAIDIVEEVEYAEPDGGPKKPKHDPLGPLLEEAVVACGYDESVEKRTELKDMLQAGSLPEDIIAYVKAKVNDKTMTNDELISALEPHIIKLVIALTAKLLYDNERAIELSKMTDKARRDEEEREHATQQKLREMGPCPAGFQWHREGDGWRCGGGSHYVRDDDPLLYRD